MSKQKSKKVNPRRIPLAKREIDKDAILEEATRDDLYHAWLLVFDTLLEQGQIAYDDMPDFTEAVNAYIRKPAHNDVVKKDETRRAERLMGIPCPHANMDISRIKSAVELEAFKQKVYRVAIHTALSVLCLGLESTGKFSEDDLRRIFFNVDLSMAEIEHGLISFTDVEKRLASHGVIIERENEDLHHAVICESV